MINCTNHFLERWTERITQITTEREKKDYISNNKDMIVEHANRTFSNSQFLWAGKIGDNTEKNFYIKDDIVFVVNKTNDALITVYRTDFGFGDTLNKHVTRELTKQIVELTQEKEDAELDVALEVERLYGEADRLEDDIKIMEEQLENLKQQRNFKKEHAKQVQSKSLNVGLELKRITQTLVNSKEYKDDLRSTR
jgi:hypothetical protein